MIMIKLKNGTDALKLLDDPSLLAVHHVCIYPDAARALLEINCKNRTVTQSRVASFARIMQEGRWLLINNGIGIDSNGDLTDGQHRLLAVVQGNTAAEFYLHTGLDPQTRVVVDTGRARTLSDTLAVRGFGHGMSNLAAAARLLYRYENDMIETTRANTNSTVPHDVLLEFIEQSLNYDLLRTVDSICTTMSRFIPGCNRSALTAFAYLIHSRDAFEAEHFLQRLRSGEKLASGDPELTLRGVLARLGKDRRTNTWHLCVYIKAWNAKRAGKSVSMLMFREDEQVPEVK